MRGNNLSGGNKNGGGSKSTSVVIKVFLAILLIAVFPIPLTIWVVRRQGMNTKVKGAIIAVAWIAYVCIAVGGTKNSDSPSNYQEADRSNNIVNELQVVSVDRKEPDSIDNSERSTVLSDNADNDKDTSATSVENDAEQEQIDKERSEKEKAEQERLEKEKAEQERLEQERLEKEKAEQERLEKERIEKAEQARKEQERLEKEKAEQEKKEQERTEKKQAEQQTRNQSSGNGAGNNFNSYNNSAQQNTTEQWVLNTSTKRIHHPSCASVKKIAAKNYATSSASLEELINQGYKTCGNCFK